jgi:GT2 family glycosyltransferase
LAFARYVRLFAPKLYQEILSEQLTPELHTIKFINAASWVISKPCLKKCGGFAPVFYHYGEDSNYADRAKFHGYKIAVYSGASIIHDRPQIFMIDLEKEKYRKRIQALALNYLTDINHTLFSQFLYLISEMAYKAFKNGTSNRKNKILIPIQSVLYVFTKLPIIISTRKLSKREKAFL